MKTLAPWSPWLVLLWGCTQQVDTTVLNVVGAHDMVVVDGLPDDGSVASVANGTPNFYTFITSADTNDLKVLKNYRPGYTGSAPATAVKGPDPLETLSIPVLDRPSVLFADEGLSTAGRRVTGRFVYALRAGGNELSVVDATPTGFNQVTASPLVMPAPITAAVAWIGSNLTAVPELSQVYVATFDGRNGALYGLSLPSNPARRAEVAGVTPHRVTDVGQEAIVALAMVPPLSARTLDAQPFCAGPSACVVLSTRRSAGTQGRTLMIELDTLRVATLAFPGPVRALRVPGAGRRIHGILDEAKCDSLSCGGVLEVDTLTGTSAAGFPVLLDFSGQPMRPISIAGALPRDLTVAASHAIIDSSTESPLGIRQNREVMDAGALTLEKVYPGYDELGVFSNSNGELAVYDGVNGVPIDYNGIRTELSTSPRVLIPRPLGDGGTADGGVNYVEVAGTISDTTYPVNSDGTTAPYRVYTITAKSDSFSTEEPFVITLSDGFLQSQYVWVLNHGAIPGLVALATSASDEQQIHFSPGLKERIQVGDQVLFSVALADGGVEACGEAPVTALAADLADVGPIPSACDARSEFTVVAGPTKPLVVLAGLEGFLGRGAVGETITYNRRYVFRPDGYEQPRPAVVMTLGSVPDVTGAYWLFSVTGNIGLYRMMFDFSMSSSATIASCLTAVPGAVALTEFPTNLTTTTPALTYPWTLITLFPNSNSVATVQTQYGIADVASPVTAAQYAYCYR